MNANATVIRPLMDGRTLIPAGTRVHVKIIRKSPPVGYVPGFGFRGELTVNGHTYRSGFGLSWFQFDDPEYGKPNEYVPVK